jgi:hypothetical protein
MKLFVPSLLMLVIGLTGCASMKAIDDLNTLPENLLRGDPSNTANAREYVSKVLIEPKGYEVKAYNRRAFNADNPKGKIFDYHSFYVFLKDGKFEHTLVFTDTPKGSEFKGCWMLDAKSDIDSYNLFVSSNNLWDVEEYAGPNGETTLNAAWTAQKIVDRIDAKYKFFGPAIVRLLPWYHQVWLFLVPPPIITYGPLLIVSVHKDNCSTAILETMVWASD